jgi:hypothetical protein
MRFTSSSRLAAERSFVAATALSIAGLFPSTAFAQEHLTDVVQFLVTNQSVQTGDFVKDGAAARAASDTMGRALLVALSTLPTSASSAGFTYRFNPTLGTLERTSDSFGPAFVERALTSGRGRAAFGVTWDHASFDRLDDRPLDDGTLVTTANRFTDEPSPFDVETLTMDVSATIVTGYATVGLTDRLDVSAAVPFIWLDLSGRRDDVYRGETFVQARATASSSGFGDAAVRAKYSLVQSGGAGLAVGGELRLPTGRSEDLLGTGELASRVVAIASYEANRVGVHGNVGVGWGGVSDEWTYGAAFVVAPAPRVTLATELMGRHLSDVPPVADVTAPHPEIPGVQTIRLDAGSPGLNVSAGAVSFKWNPGGQWLVKASVMLPVSHGGLTAGTRTTLGLDYAFGQ